MMDDSPSSCEVCSAFTHVAACTLARSPIRDRYPGASDISSPPCLLRLLPAGANRRVGLAPTGKRRLVTAHVEILTFQANRVHHFCPPLEIKFCILQPKPMIQGCFSF